MFLSQGSVTRLPAGGINPKHVLCDALSGPGCGISIRHYFTLGQKDNSPYGDGSSNASLLPQPIWKLQVQNRKAWNRIITLSEMRFARHSCCLKDPFRVKTYIVLINNPAEASKEENERNVIRERLVHSRVLTPQDTCRCRQKGFLFTAYC